MKNLQRYFTDMFVGLSRLSVGDSGAPSGSSPSPTGSSAAPASAPAASSAPETSLSVAMSSGEAPAALVTQYLGSKELNPNGLPLRFDVSGMSESEVDDLIKIANTADEIFLTEDEIAAQKKDQPADEKKPDATKEEKKVDEAKPVATADEDKEVKALLDHAGLTQEEFTKLSEKSQQKLAEQFVAFNQINEKAATIEQEHTQLKTDVDMIYKDPVIAARIEEINTGKNFVAAEDRLPDVNDEEITKIDKMLSEGQTKEAKEMINTLVKQRAQAAVKIERAVADRQAYIQRAKEDAEGVFKEIGALDPRLSIKEQNWKKLNPNHPEWQEFGKGPADLLKFCTEKKITLEQIKLMGSKKLYAAYAAEKGWDAQRDKNIYKSGAKSLVEKIKEASLKARSVDHGKQSVNPVSSQSTTAIDRQSLIDELTTGDTKNYDRLLDMYDGNREMIGTLDTIFRDAMRIREQDRQSSQ